MMTRIAALAAFALMPLPALASFEPPEGCTGFLTVQMAGCMVSNHFTCEADPEGHKRHVTFRENGPTGASLVDGEYQWLETYGPGREEALGLPIEDPASISELIETGEDSYDFTVIDMASGEPVESRIVGVDRLSGEDEVIDGKPLLGTIFAMEKVDAEGEVELSVTGRQFVSEEFDLFFAGIERVEVGGRTIEIDHTPRRFIRPGQPGFFDDAPAFGCNATDISYP